MIELQDYEIRCIEEEIVNVYNDNWSKYPECDCLLTVRRDIINEGHWLIRRNSCRISSPLTMRSLLLCGKCMTVHIASGTLLRTKARILTTYI